MLTLFKRVIRCIYLPACIIHLLIITHANAQIKTQSPLHNYIHKIYTSDDGLPQNRGRKILQTRNGILWIGTQDGLARFNGFTFQVYDKNNTPELSHNDITSLCETSDSTLWIGTFNGLTKWKNGKFSFVPINTGPVRGISQDSMGILWIGTMNKGVYRYKDGFYDSITTIQGLTSNSINTIILDKEGNLWVALSGLGLNIYNKDRCLFYNTANGLPNNSVRSFYVAADSTVWIGTENGLVRWKKKIVRIYTTKEGLSDNIIPSLAEDKSGAIWIGTERGGICRWKNDTVSEYKSTDRLSGNYITSIYEDREGNLWVGTLNSGINLFCKSKVTNLTARNNLPPGTIRGLIIGKDGNLWIGTEGGGVSFLYNNTFVPFLKNVLPSDYIRSLFQDSHGTFWIGIREGLARYKNGYLKIYTVKDGLSQNYIREIAEDPDGNIWVGTYNNGVNRFENEKFINYQNRGLPANLIHTLTADHSGTLWIGSNEGLFCLYKDSVTHLKQKELPSEPFFDIIEDEEHTIWMGSYGGGLVRYKKGAFTRYTVSDGLFDNVILKILDDDKGNLWLGSMKGIGCVSKKVLDDFSNKKTDSIQCRVFTVLDGMVSSDCASRVGCKSDDDRLFFPTTKGIVVIDPNKITENPLPPPIIIERVVLNGNDYSPYSPAIAPPGIGQVEIYYGVMSFIAPQRTFSKYKLEGFDPDWKSVGTRRVAYYTNLSPGKYIFKVIACNNDGVWNETGASFSFELAPHFYETKWFYAIIIFTGIMLIWGIYWLRIIRLVKHRKELEKRVAERTAQLEAANKELEAFSYSVSHDLRAPLRSIDGFSTALLEDYESKLDEQGKVYLNRLREASQKMNLLIDDMLKLSRVTRGELQKTNVNLSSIALEIISNLQKQDPERNVEIKIQPDIIVKADENYMTIVMDNLINNAWKFTSKHSSAKIEFGSGIGRNNQKHYYIRDDGAGFDMAYANKLFGAFQRMHSSNEFEGIGIGLAIVQRIIHRHGGQIWAEGKIEKGAAFYFTIPE